MTEDEVVDRIRCEWGLEPKATSVTVPINALADLIALSQHGRTLITATALALRSGLSNTANYSETLLAEADDLDRRLWRALSGLWK